MDHQTHFPYQDSVWTGSTSKPYAQPVTTLIFLGQTISLCTLLWNTCNLILSVMTPQRLVDGCKHSGGTYYCHSHDEVLDLQTCCFYYDSNWSCTVAYSGNTEQRVQEKLLVQTVNNLQSNPQRYLWLTDTAWEGGKNHWQHLTSKSVPPNAEMLLKCPLSLGNRL